MFTTVSIPGIHCASCAALIKDVSSEFPSVQNVDVDIQNKNVTIEHSEDFDFQKWTQEVESLGSTYMIHPIS